jgi:hypothetical protein
MPAGCTLAPTRVRVLHTVDCPRVAVCVMAQVPDWLSRPLLAEPSSFLFFWFSLEVSHPLDSPSAQVLPNASMDVMSRLAC